MTQEIIENNKLIAEFMGFKEEPFNRVHNMFTKEGEQWFTAHNSQYHTSWDWLMPAWLKFRELKFDDVKHQFYHSKHKEMISRVIAYMNDGTPKLAFEALSIAIKWYNTTTPKVNQTI